MPSRRLSQVLSGEASLDLSPSDSSGGTYMWDEEGLEPLGSATSHPCGSYDSDLNSLVSRSDPRSCYLLERDMRSARFALGSSVLCQ